MKYRNLVILMICSNVAQATAASTSFILTEKSLEKQIEAVPPELKGLEISVLSAKKAQNQFNESFSSKLTAGYEYTKTNEQSLISYVPVMTPVEKMSLGYSKNFKRGFALSVQAYTNKSSTSNGLLTDGITTGISTRLTVDLYKNLWGKVTNSSNQILGLTNKKAELQKSIQTKVFKIKLKRIYWSLVANNESILVSEKLFRVAKDQLQDTKKRLRSRVADVGELARAQSQVAAREASLLYLKYQRESIFQQLKTLLPGLADREIQLGKYEMDTVVRDVLDCTKHLESLRKVPYDYTLLDDVLGLSKDIYGREKKITGQYAAPDLSFFVEAKNQSVHIGQYSDAFSNFPDDRKEALAAGVQLSISLDSAPRDVRDVQAEIEKKRFMKEQEETLGRMSTYHTQVVRSIALLNQVVSQLKTNTLYLEQSLKEVKKKYDQARISYRDYINENNLLLESNLNEISTKLEIINTLYNYFSVFTETKCKINK